MQIRNFSQAKGIVNQNGQTTNELSKSLEKLSTGYRINRAADDASGLGISEKMKCSLKETGRVVENVEEGISVTRVADGALQEVSDMIIRAQELTMQAANGTYTQEEREAIAAEIRQLYGEMDRIYDSTTWNTINLFKLEYYEYIKSDEVVEWGYNDYTYSEDLVHVDFAGLLPNSEIDWIEGKPFDDPEDPEPATVTMELDSYFFENPEEMVGKSFKAGSYTYTVSSTDLESATDGEGKVDIEALLKATITRTVGSSESTATSTYLDPDAVEVYEDGTVVLGFELNTYRQTVDMDDGTMNYDTKDETGDAQVSGLNANDTTVSSQNSYDFEALDLFKTGALKFDTPAVTSSNITLLSEKSDTATLSESDYNNLIRNGLTVGTTSIKFESLLTGPDMTVGEIRTAVYDAIKNLSGYTVTGDPSSFSVSAHNVSTTSDSTSYIVAETTASAQTASINKDGVAINPVTVTSTVLQSPSFENVAITEYDLTFPSSDPFSIKINGTEYTIIKESTKASDPSFTAENPGYSLSSDNLNSSSTITIKDDATKDEILAAIAGKYASSNEVSATVENGKLVLTADVADKPITVGVSNGSSNRVYTQTYKTTNTQPSSSVLGIGTTYLYRDMELTFSFSDVMTDGALDVDKLSKLDNVAFKIGSYTYYLQGSSSEDYVPYIDPSLAASSTYRAIDLSGATSLDELANLIKNNTSPSAKTVEIGINGSFTLDYGSIRTGSGYTVTDTIAPSLGLFTGYDDETGEASFVPADPDIEGDLGYTQTNTADGGTLIGNPLTELDFSKYNQSNFDELLGKGFTINCATCEHEKNTFIFVNNEEDLGSLPQGTYYGENGEQYDIRTYALELSKLDLTDAASFVASIAAEYNDILSEHTLEFVVDPENPTVLTIQDKRVGMVSNRLPSIETGVYGNYLYDVDKAPVDSSENDAFYGLGWEKPLDYEEYWYGGLKIFVDSDMQGEDQYITIRLPYLDATIMDIEPPKPILDAISDAMEENAKLREMGIKISEYRGNIGADYNRLQYAYGAFTTSEVYETDSMSTIRDADIALEMLKYTKDNILIQSQQSMLSHALEVKNNLVQLLE